MKTPLPLPAKTRTKPAEVRLKELMDAAEKLFLERGVEATTVSEIVEEAKVAKGTFYHYFDSKTEMLLALRERYMQHFLEELGEAVARVATREPGAWTDQLQAWIAANVRTYIATYRMHDIVFTKHHHLDRANKEKEAILDQLAAILEGGAGCRGMASGVPEGDGAADLLGGTRGDG